MRGFKSAILAIFPFCQNGTFEPVHEIQNVFWPKDFFWGIMKVPYTKNIHNVFQGLSITGFRSVKVQTETFLKKDSRDFKYSFYLGFLWIPSKPGKQNYKVPFFLGIHNYKKTSVSTYQHFTVTKSIRRHRIVQVIFRTYLFPISDLRFTISQLFFLRNKISSENE